MISAITNVTLDYVLIKLLIMQKKFFEQYELLSTIENCNNCWNEKDKNKPIIHCHTTF